MTAEKYSVLVPVGKGNDTTSTKKHLSGFRFAIIQGYMIGTVYHVQEGRAGAMVQK